MHTLLKSTLLGLFLTATAFAQQNPPERKAIPPELIAMLEKQALYHPTRYKSTEIEAFTKAGGKRIDYETSDGKQSAWLIAPASGQAERLWLVCGGNAARALDMASIGRSQGAKGEAWLMVDYPGYGECAGEPSPDGIRRNVKQSALSAISLLKMDPAKAPAQLRVFGHSLGCAAALLAVEEFHLKSAVLCAPFTSTTEMARDRLKLPPEIKLTQVFDNRIGLAELKKNNGKAWILHGENDVVIPIAMSKTLANEFKPAVELKAIAAAGHNDIFTVGSKDLEEAIAQARK